MIECLKATPIAELDAVSVTFSADQQSVPALKNANLRINPGESISITGRSGSGKSTLVSVLALMRRPSSGQVRVHGHDLEHMSNRDRAALRGQTIGIVFQAFHLEPALTVRENVSLAWHFSPGRRTRTETQARVDHLLGAVGLEGLESRTPYQLSGGQRQRVAIARALFNEPQLLVADEPTGNLDEENADHVRELILGLPQRLGTAVVVVTHDQEIARAADRRFTIAHGTLARA